MVLPSIFDTNQPDVISQSLVHWMREQEIALRDGYRLFRGYYRGEQKSLVTDRMKEFIKQELTFRDNFCDVVVDVMAERLNVLGFDSGGNDELSQLMWEWWQQNRMDLTQKIVHTEAIMLGDAYVMVDWDGENSRPRFQYQDPEMMLAHYNSGTRRLDMISKKWVEQPTLDDPKLTRLNLYYPDRIEKYAERSGTWRQYQDEGEESWPTPWVNKQGRPLGIPVFHFKNRALSDDYGSSELADIIPLQDLLNKTLIDLTQVMDVQAFRQRWTLGIIPPAQFDVTPGAVWSLTADNEGGAQVGEFEGASTEGILRVMETLIQHIAGQSRTPQHLFHISGNYPSGEALKTAEAGLVKKVEERQVNFGNAWEDMMQMAVKLDILYGSGSDANLESILSTSWDDPETRNELQMLQGLQIKLELGVTKHQIYRELGYTQVQVDQMDIDREEERMSETNIGAEILRNFNAGEI